MVRRSPVIFSAKASTAFMIAIMDSLSVMISTLDNSKLLPAIRASRGYLGRLGTKMPLPPSLPRVQLGHSKSKDVTENSLRSCQRDQILRRIVLCSTFFVSCLQVDEPFAWRFIVFKL